MGKRIIIMAGGTGGHVFPALAVAKYLAAQGWQVSWLGTVKGLENRVIPEQGIEMDCLSVAGFRGKGLISKVTAVFKLAKACFEVLRIFQKRKPDVVLGMGGFVAAPGGLMSSFLKIPLLIHEQNRVPGTTNRMLMKRANKVMEAFPGSFEPSVQAVFTGNPLRAEFKKLKDKNVTDKQEGEAINILVVGGSQGAQILNQIVPEALAGLSKIRVKHQTGQVMQKEVKEQYEQLSMDADVLAFIDDMVAVYEWADVVICRAGAMTVSEVAAAGLPAVFIPLPHAIDDHQTANARYLSDAGAAVLLPQKELNKESLLAAVNSCTQQLESMSRAAKSMARPDATETVAGYCIKEVGA